MFNKALTFNFVTRILTQFALVLVLLACQEDDGENLTACFTTNTSSAKVGEEIQFTNCSVGADNYQYNFANGSPSTSTEENPKCSFRSGGEYTVTLTVTSENGAGATDVQKIIVEDPKYKILDRSWFGTEALNFEKIDGKYFYTLQYSTGSLFLEINSLNSKFENDQKTILPVDNHTNVTYMSRLENGNYKVYAVNTRSNNTIEYLLDSELKLLEDSERAGVWLGKLSYNGNNLFYGAIRKEGVFVPTIQIRSLNDVVLEEKEYEIFPDGIFGSMIESNNKIYSIGMKQIEESNDITLVPVFLQLDDDLDIKLKEDLLENVEEVSSQWSQYALPTRYKIRPLDNGAFMLNARNVGGIIDGSGKSFTEIADTSWSNFIEVPGGFVLLSSTDIYFHDNSGAQLKSFYAPNQNIVGFLSLDNNLVYLGVDLDCRLTEEDCDETMYRAFLAAVSQNLVSVGIND
ncbi:PKD domain-containing protein [Reichenbachiella sp.]|uniref:PKD domain-containing protein n=1 Tax=Reichenbachiella sp. TaxID=2184521 RepID=UPI003B5A1BDE